MDENEFEEKDPSVEYYPSPYCNLIEGFEKACYEFSILELWAENGAYEDSKFDQLTTNDILNKINNVNYSGRFLVDKDFQSLLGNIQKDSNGQITGAAALEFKLIGHMNGTAAKLQTIKADSALGEYVSALRYFFMILFSDYSKTTFKTLGNVRISFQF